MQHEAGSWAEDVVGGHPCDVYQPATPNENGYALLYLHDAHGQRLRDQSPFVEQFERYSVPVFAPITGQSWWTDRVSPDFDTNLSGEAHVLKNMLPFIADRVGAKPPKIGLFGTGMGGQGALRLAYRHPDVFPVVAGISPAVDFQLRHKELDDVLLEMYPDPESARQDTATLHIHPLNWPRHQFFCCDPTDHRWIDGVDRLRMKLWSLGVPHECDLETTAGDHGLAYYNHMAARAIEFLMNGLDRERLRLV